MILVVCLGKNLKLTRGKSSLLANTKGMKERSFQSLKEKHQSMSNSQS
jgi:hypothetical protein